MTSEEVAAKAGIHYRTLMRLIERGVFKPEKVHVSPDSYKYIWNLAEVSKAMIAGAKLRQAAQLKAAVFRGDFS